MDCPPLALSPDCSQQGQVICGEDTGDIRRRLMRARALWNPGQMTGGEMGMKEKAQ